MKTPIKVAVTGAAGQISYSLLFRLIAGDLWGLDQPIILHLLDIPEAQGMLDGVVMELQDCASPRLAGVMSTSVPEEAFADVDYAFLVGSRPRTAGMERRDLLAVNGEIFSTQGRALGEVAKKSVRVLVVGNPANTNALIAMENAVGIDASCFSAMTRLDHNRAVNALARHLSHDVTNMARVSIWGNHSPSQYPDLTQALVSGERVLPQIDLQWYKETFIPQIQLRGAAVIKQRGRSSAASAANAALDHMRDWIYSTPKGDWKSMAVLSDGSYGVAPGIFFSFPVVSRHGQIEVVKDIPQDEIGRHFMQANQAELLAEKEMVKHLIPR